MASRSAMIYQLSRRLRARETTRRVRSSSSADSEASTDSLAPGSLL